MDWTYTGGSVGTLEVDVDITAVQNSERLTFSPTAGFLKLKDNADPYNLFRVSLSADTVLSFTETNGSTAFIEKTPGLQYLAVYETEPVVSLLDIFWETSSAGLLSDLNDAILNGSSAGANFDFFNLNPFTEGLPQSTQLSPAYILNSAFQLTTNFGDVITGGTLVLDSVTEFLQDNDEDTGLNVQLETNPIPGPYFDLVDQGASNVGPWQIQTTDAYYNNVFYFYEENAIKRNFRFSFTATVNGQDSNIVKLASLGNEIPVITSPALGSPLPSPIFTNRAITTGLITDATQNLAPLAGINGASNRDLAYQNQGELAGLSWRIDYIRKGANNQQSEINVATSSFSLEQTANTATKKLECQILNSNPQLEPDLYYINVVLADGGASVSTLVVLNFGLLVPSTNIYNSKVRRQNVQGDSDTELLIILKQRLLKLTQT